MIALILPGISRAESKDTKTIELNVVQVMQLAGDFVEQGKLDAAQDILTKVPNTSNPALETERDFTHRYAVSVSNNKLDIWGFVPTITVSYTKRESNIWQREFDKTALEFTMQQRF